MEPPRSFRRLAFTLVTLVTGLTLSLGPLQPALALTAENPVPIIAPGLPVAITANVPEAANTTYRNIYSELTRAGVMALTNALQLFLGQMAYDAAEYIASGGKGQGKLFFDGKVGEYLTNVGSDAAGEFMAGLSDSSFFQGIGFNLCQPRDPTTLLRLQVSLGDLGSQLFPTPSVPNVTRYARPQPRCDFQAVLDNYDTLFRTMSDGEVIRNLEQSFDPGLSQLGTLTSVYNRFLTDTQRQVTDAAASRQEGGGFRPLEGLISGNVRTPASVIQEATNEQMVRKPGADQSRTVQTILSNAWNSGPVALAMYTGSIFLNTLASKFMQRIFEKGLGGSFTPSGLRDLSGPDSVSVYGKTDARNANIDLKNPPAQQTVDYDVVSQMQTCLPAQRGAWNCVMDQSLVQAIRSNTRDGGTTVREAIDRGWLHGDWRLIPETRTRENQDPQCYTQAYCAGNLQKMRLMRILPIGFELAANSEANKRRCDTSDGCFTLAEVVKGFGSCNASGGLDAAHPWCRLIDPNWVITSFPQQCTLTGYTDTLVSSKLPIRKEECQEIQTCLARNDKGECTGGYGHCMAERSVYRFQADVCPAYAASCRIYTDTANRQVGYLRNTIDRAACDASNAGCLWYATTRATGTSESLNWAANTSTGNRIYFKAATEGQTATTKGFDSCPAGDEGCTRLYAFTPGKATLNLLINGSFESTDPTTSTDVLGWKLHQSSEVPPPLFSAAPAFNQSVLNDAAYLGTKSMQISSAPPKNLLQSVAVVGGRSYVLSFYARSEGGNARLVTQIYPTRSAESRDPSFGFERAQLAPYYRNGVDIVTAPTLNNIALYRKDLASELSQEWQRFEYAFVLPTSTQGLHFWFAGDRVLIDGLQLEEGEFATDFVETFTSGLQAVFMKIAPEELQCTKPATDTTRSELCSAFAQTCNQFDAGCQGYTDREGGQEVPAILSQNDVCPTMCVGYSEYRKSASSFDLVKDIDTRFSDPEEPTSAYFIPRTAGQCTQQDVGCETFTILDDTGRSDGATATFSYLRSCEKPGVDSETYFTWEGADTVGYQLRTWSLKKDTGPLDLGPRILTKIQADQISFKEPDTCNEASWRTAADPDCRQFYDARGRKYYRYFSQTILSTNECTSLRLPRSNRADCEKTGGQLNDRSECTYGAFLPESRSCEARATGCRMFTGANSGNTESVLRQSFRDDIAPFASAGVTVSSEALLVGDQSLRVGDPGGLGVAQASAVFPSQEIALYRATFWAKIPATSASLIVRTSAEDGSGEVVIGSVRLTPEWQRFTIGFFEGAPNSSRTRLTFTGPLLQGAGYGFFLDEVSVVRVQDVVYVRNGTWTTPAQCDQGLDGAEEPQAMLNCKEYTNRVGQTVTARRFTRLCRETAIGCTAFIDTRNTDQTYGQKIVQPNPIDPARYVPSVVTLPPDRNIYLIDDPSKRCNAENMSCRAFGKPNLAPDRQTLDSERPYETVFFKDDITRYSSALCKPSEAYCAEYKFGSVKEYFRNPGNSLCDYREAKIISDGSGPPQTQLAGWYVKGSADTPCYPSILEGGTAYGLARSGDRTYKGYVGTCPQAAGECTELRHIDDASNPAQRVTKSYFYIKNDRLDTSSCNGTVDLGRGCVLFRDMSSGSLNFNARATYEKYKAEGFRPTTPIDCRNNPENPLCNQPGKCVGTETLTTRSLNSGGGLQETVTTSDWMSVSECRRDDECRPPDVVSDRQITYGVGCTDNGLCAGTVTAPVQVTRRVGTCNAVTPERANDANLLLKVSVDRECSQWLGCRSSETVLDPSTNKYKEICAVPALCDASTGQAGDQFCASYVDRRTTSTEPILSEGAVIDAKLYASRPLGLGQRDYSGYTMPNAFQVMDLKSVLVAADGLPNGVDIANRFSQDYRLAAAVAIPVVRSGFSYIQGPIVSENQAEMLSSTDGLSIAHPGLKLCRHVGSRRVGYYRDADLRGGSPVCYLPIHSDSDLLDFQKVAENFSIADPMSNPFLTQAYPPAECRAHPEQDAPYPASFTTEWDTSKTPAKAVRRMSGFASANTCEFGEDCSCTYKRVEYENTPAAKFYGQYSNGSPPGICVGGPRDGSACIPGKIFNLGSVATPVGEEEGTSGSRLNAVSEASTNQLCGPPEMGGQCMPFKTVTIIRGIFGQCLERDLTRTIGSNRDLTPCLSWNPTQLLVGDKDPYHYTASAGYMPPQNSGQYYCLSDARQPKTITLTSTHFAQVGGKYTGEITKLDFDDDYVSEDEIGADGDESGSIISGGSPKGSEVARQCEYTDDDQDNGNQDTDSAALRIVNTGREANRQYTESFLRIDPAMIARAYSTVGEPSPQGILNAISDQIIGYIGFSPIQTRNSTARIGCGYNADWVDNINVGDWDEIDQVRPADVQWQNAFNAGFSGVLTRSTEALLLDDRNEEYVHKADCVETHGEYPASSQCYFKTWEVGYRTDREDTKPKFRSLYSTSQEGQIRPPVAGAPPRTFEYLRREPFYAKCESSKPYFSIRAVFQSKAIREDASPMPKDVFPASSRSWHLAGFWVTACGGTGTDEHFIYMYPRIEYADVCKELAEVVSRDSGQNAAFTDRVWKDGTFTIPMLGISYNARYAPFSSALNTRAVGKDPLFQTGQEVAGYSSLNPPTFLAAPYRTYYTSDRLGPKDKWGYLTNIFARVYRIYTYKPYAITQNSTACLADGPNKGKRCTPNSQGQSTECSLSGVCSEVALQQSGATGQTEARCNALSGINTGLTCLAGDNAAACRLAPIQIGSGGVGTRLRQLPCLTQPSWTLVDGSWRNGTTNSDGSPREFTQEQAGFEGAFRCPASPVSLRRDGPLISQWGTFTALQGNTPGLLGAKCFAPTDLGDTLQPSAQCPERIIDGMEVPVPAGGTPQPATARCMITQGQTTGRCSINIPAYTITKDGKRLEMPSFVVNHTDEASSYASQCRQDMDCWFTAMNYWDNPPFQLDTQEKKNFAAAPNGNAFASARSELRVYMTARGGDGGLGWNARANTACLNDGVHSFEQCGGIVSTNNRYVPKSGADELNIADSDTWRRHALVERGSAGGHLLGSLPFRYPGAAIVNSSVAIGACIVPDSSLELQRGSGLCVGGVRDGQRCSMSVPTDCLASTGDTPALLACGPVATRQSDGTWRPASQCLNNAPGLLPFGTPGVDLNTDNNLCTHEVGYSPQADLCPDPKDEFCGLIAYNVRRPAESVRQTAPAKLPTDVTLGLHSLSYLLGTGSSEAPYTATYLPRPPMVAAPDIQSCATPGKCAVQGLNKISVNGSSEGNVTVTSAQAKITMRFYAWAAHNQMPLRSIVIDWGDGETQTISDGKMKNRKPFCAARKECTTTITGAGGVERVESQGLTCGTDTDCPVGGGTCQALGTCRDNPNITCSKDAHCRLVGGTGSDVCTIRTLFGNAAEACEENHFEFTHLYTCNGPTSLPLCRTNAFGRESFGRPTASEQGTFVGQNTFRCERDPERVCNPSNVADTCAPGDRCLANLAPAGGCWDDQIQNCRFTPRVQVVDNWGWCTGECRAGRDSGGAPMDVTRGGPTSPIALHPYGGCYSAVPKTGSSKIIRTNVNDLDPFKNECSVNLPGSDPQFLPFRPWIVYQGSVNLRSSR